MSGIVNVLGAKSGVIGTTVAADVEGKVLQTVQNTTDTETDGTFTSTARQLGDFNVVITPTKTTSKIMVTFSCGGMFNNIPDSIGMIIKRAISGGATSTIRQQVRYAYGNPTNNVDWIPCPLYSQILDSPSTTSACTYSMWISFETSRAGEMNPNGGTNPGVVTAVEYAPN